MPANSRRDLIRDLKGQFCYKAVETPQIDEVNRVHATSVQR